MTSLDHNILTIVDELRELDLELPPNVTRPLASYSASYMVLRMYATGCFYFNPRKSRPENLTLSFTGKQQVSCQGYLFCLFSASCIMH